MTSTADKLRAYADSESGWQDIDDLCRLAADELDAATARIHRLEQIVSYIMKNMKKPTFWYDGQTATILSEVEGEK